MSAEHVTESRWAWLRYFLRWCWYAEPRPTSPREAELLDEVAYQDGEAARLRAELAEKDREIADLARRHRAEVEVLNGEISKKITENELLKYEVDLTAKMLNKANLWVMAGEAALASKVPPEVGNG